MAAGTYDFTFIKGNTMDFRVRLRCFDAAGSAFVFRTVSLSGSEIVRASADDGITVLDEPDGEGRMATLSWSLTPVESRLLGDGRVSSYELGRRIGGTEETLLRGAITMNGGVNTDA